MTWTDDSTKRTAMKFKVGDRVKITRSYAPHVGGNCVGKVAIITERHVGMTDQYYEAKNEDGTSNNWIWFDGELEPAARESKGGAGKFAVGDRVCVRSLDAMLADFGPGYSHGRMPKVALGFNVLMGDRCGLSATVVEKKPGEWYVLRFDCDSDNDAYCWNDDMLLAAPPAAKLAPVFLVWREPSMGHPYDNAPTRTHPSREAAQAEASRLATKHPGVRFHVVQSVAHVEVTVPKPSVVEYATA